MIQMWNRCSHLKWGEKFAGGCAGEAGAQGAGIRDDGFDANRVIVHAIVDLFNNSRLYMAAMGRADGKAIGRIVLRTERSRVPPKTHFYCDVISERRDGTFAYTTGARAVMDTPAEISVASEINGTVSQLWTAHQKQLQAGGGDSNLRLARTREEILGLLDRHHVLIRDFNLRRKLFAVMSEMEQANTAVVTNSYAQGVARGSASPEIMAEVLRMKRVR